MDKGRLATPREIEKFLRSQTYFDPPDSPVSELPYQRLLFAVLAQAFQEAADEKPRKEKWEERQRKWAMHSARRYLRRGEYGYVCELLGLDKDLVRGIVRDNCGWNHG